MSTATSSATTTDVNWGTQATPATGQQWQSQEQYQQYYNYYQSMSQAAVVPPTTSVAPPAVTTAIDPTAAYSQDYSKAWDDYYKAYYGQTYALSAPPTQYPPTQTTAATPYNYDQYGYPNMSAPPPSYQYDTASASVTTPAVYPSYQQPPTAVPTNTQSYPYTDVTGYGVPPTSTWSAPPPSYNQPPVAAPMTYNQAPYQQPPPSFDQSCYDTNIPPTNYESIPFKENMEGESYKDKYPPPQFDTGYNRGGRGNNRGRGFYRGSGDDNFRRPRGNRFGQNNRPTRGRGSFNDRPQFSNEEMYNEDNSNQYNNDYNQDRGRGQGFRGQGGESSYRGRGGESSYGGRGGESSYRGRGGESSNRGRGDTWRGRGGESSFRGREAYNSGDFNNEYNYAAGDGGCPPWDDMESENVTKQSPWAMEDSAEGEGEVLLGWSNNKSPLSLMDIVVKPCGQSPVIVRRQSLIDQWKSAVENIVQRQIPIKSYWESLKSALIPEVEGLLAPSFAMFDNFIYCDLYLDDVFLVQTKAHNEDAAVEEASKLMWLSLQSPLYVEAASRKYGDEIVPVFCVSKAATGNATPLAAFIKSNVERNEMNKEVDDKVKENRFLMPPDNVTELKGVSSDFKDDDIFLVVDSGSNEKDQAITILNNTARFNNISIDYKHEKPKNAPHISQCVITINGQEFERSEARDYLYAKREAADKAVTIFRGSCPQISINFENAKEVAKEDLMKAGKNVEESISDYLKQFLSSDQDEIYRFSQSFSNEDRDIVAKLVSNLNLCSKQEGKGVLYVFKMYPCEEMKKRILRNSFCAQYKLLESN